jgi:hypothetical protein
VGDAYVGFLHAPQKLARDLGYLSVQRRVVLKTCNEDTEEWLEGVISGRLRQMYSISVVKDLPSWFNDLVLDDIVPDQAWEPFERHYHEKPAHVYG